MIRLVLVFSALSLSAGSLSAGAAFAQSEPAAGSPASVGEHPNAVATERTTADGRPIMLLPSPTPADQAWRLKYGDPYVDANEPVRDTPENRSRYGGPDSTGGRHTAPKGN